ncbi:MAG TPA: hypothetical protein VIG30_12430 [Ktedonobacterales bacterium]
MTATSTPMATPASPLIAGLDRTIAIIEAEVRERQGQAGPQGAMRGGYGAPLPPGAPPAPAPSAQAPGSRAAGSQIGGSRAAGAQVRSLEDMSLFLSRLKQIRDWLEQDDRLLPVVDTYIGQQVMAAEKRGSARDMRMAVATTLVGAVLGWLMASLAAPNTMLHAMFSLFAR